MARFDAEAARKAGYTDAEIARFLSSQVNLDYDGATKAGYTDADIIARFSGEPKREAVQKVGGAINDGIKAIPRQLGLTARAGIEGVAQAVGTFSNPVASALNLGALAIGQRAPFGTAQQAASSLADLVGLPKAETPTERVAQDTAQMMAGVGTFGAAGNAAKAGGEAAKRAGEWLTQKMLSQVTGAAGAGLAGGAVREGGGTPTAQMIASAGGAVIGGAAPDIIKGTAERAVRAVSPKLTDQQLNMRIERLVSEGGVKWADVPEAARAALRRDLRDAMDAGKELSPDAVRRLLDYRTVGATPLRGTVTLDPVQVTKEKNLAKVAANSGDDSLHGLPRLQNDNNAQLIAKANEVAGPEPADLFTAGKRAVDTIQSKDARFAAVENELYKRARESAGRNIPLDREQFVLDAYKRLANENKGAFLPDDINTLLEQIRTGKARYGGNEIATPFDVDVIDNLKTTLAAASRGAKDGNVRRAVGLVREALEDVKIAPPQTGPGLVTQAQGQAMAKADDLSASAMRAFDRARRVARARRNWQESSPAIQAALEDGNPDRFVRNFVISETAPFAEVAKIARELKADPEAMQAARSAIAGYLKSKATGGAADEVARFSQKGYNDALRSLQKKLPLFFSPEDVATLQAIGRTASYESFQPVGSAVNNSNSGAMVVAKAMDALSALAAKVPLGKAVITDPMKAWNVSVGTRAARNVVPSMIQPPPAGAAAPNALLPLFLLTAPPARD